MLAAPSGGASLQEARSDLDNYRACLTSQVSKTVERCAVPLWVAFFWHLRLSSLAMLGPRFVRCRRGGFALSRSLVCACAFQIVV